ncbi:hypothetical protein FOA52_003330 [Chlamydomonas sp. UWO 241]|nr:hypothetical protein FOA52_003330 [Chlamydomonas sp. UWO 241]
MAQQLPQIVFGCAVVAATLPLHEYVYYTFQQEGGFLLYRAAREMTTVLAHLQHLEDDFDELFATDIAILGNMTPPPGTASADASSSGCDVSLARLSKIMAELMERGQIELILGSGDVEAAPGFSVPKDDIDLLTAADEDTASPEEVLQQIVARTRDIFPGMRAYEKHLGEHLPQPGKVIGIAMETERGVARVKRAYKPGMTEERMLKEMEANALHVKLVGLQRKLLHYLRPELAVSFHAKMPSPQVCALLKAPECGMMPKLLMGVSAMLEKQEEQRKRRDARMATAAAAAGTPVATGSGTPVASGGGAPSPYASAQRCASCQIAGGELEAGQAPLVCSSCGLMWHTWCVTPVMDAAGVAHARADVEWFCPEC